VKPYTLDFTVAILMFRAYLGSLKWMVFCDFLFFRTFSLNLGKGTPYRESAMNTLTFSNKRCLNNKQQ
jgi:hypothetical protein